MNEPITNRESKVTVSAKGSIYFEPPKSKVQVNFNRSTPPTPSTPLPEQVLTKQEQARVITANMQGNVATANEIVQGAYARQSKQVRQENINKVREDPYLTNVEKVKAIIEINKGNYEQANAILQQAYEKHNAMITKSNIEKIQQDPNLDKSTKMQAILEVAKGNTEQANALIQQAYQNTMLSKRVEVIKQIASNPQLSKEEKMSFILGIAKGDYSAIDKINTLSTIRATAKYADQVYTYGKSIGMLDEDAQSLAKTAVEKGKVRQEDVSNVLGARIANMEKSSPILMSLESFAGTYLSTIPVVGDWAVDQLSQNLVGIKYLKAKGELDLFKVPDLSPTGVGRGLAQGLVAYESVLGGFGAIKLARASIALAKSPRVIESSVISTDISQLGVKVSANTQILARPSTIDYAVDIGKGIAKGFIDYNPKHALQGLRKPIKVEYTPLAQAYESSTVRGYTTPAGEFINLEGQVNKTMPISRKHVEVDVSSMVERYPASQIASDRARLRVLEGVEEVKVKGVDFDMIDVSKPAEPSKLRLRGIEPKGDILQDPNILEPRVEEVRHVDDSMQVLEQKVESKTKGKMEGKIESMGVDIHTHTHTHTPVASIPIPKHVLEGNQVELTLDLTKGELAVDQQIDQLFEPKLEPREDFARLEEGMGIGTNIGSIPLPIIDEPTLPRVDEPFKLAESTEPINEPLTKLTFEPLSEPTQIPEQGEYRIPGPLKYDEPTKLKELDMRGKPPLKIGDNLFKNINKIRKRGIGSKQRKEPFYDWL